MRVWRHGNLRLVFTFLTLGRVRRLNANGLVFLFQVTEEEDGDPFDGDVI